MKSLWWAEEAWNQHTLDLVAHLRPQGTSGALGVVDDILSRTFNAAQYNTAGTPGITTRELLPPADFLADVFTVLGDQVVDSDGIHIFYRDSDLGGEGPSPDATGQWRYNIRQYLHRKHSAPLNRNGFGTPKDEGKSFFRRAEMLSIVTPWTEEEFENVIGVFLPCLTGMDDQEAFFALPHDEKLQLVASRSSEFMEWWAILAAFVKNRHLTAHSPSPALHGVSNWQDFIIELFFALSEDTTFLNQGLSGSLCAILANPDAKQDQLLRAREIAGNKALEAKSRINGLSLNLQLEKIVGVYYEHPNLGTGWTREELKPLNSNEEMFVKMLFSKEGSGYAADPDTYLPRLALEPGNEALVRELTREAILSGSAVQVSRCLPFVGVVLHELIEGVGESADSVPLEWLIELL